MKVIALLVLTAFTSEVWIVGGFSLSPSIGGPCDGTAQYVRNQNDPRTTITTSRSQINYQRGSFSPRAVWRARIWSTDVGSVFDVNSEKLGGLQHNATTSSDEPLITNEHNINGKEEGSVSLHGVNNIIFTDPSNPLPEYSQTSRINGQELDENVALKQKHTASNELTGRSEAPGIGNIVRFAIPATGVWLCSPLLSLIDTAAVGLLAGTSHQAALSPAVAVIDYASLLLAFLYAATTNLVASSKQQSSETSDIDRNKDVATSPQGTLLMSMRLSLLVGAGLGTVLFALSKPLLKGLLGNGAFDPAICVPAVRYVRVRAIGVPAAAVLGTAQAACLGLKDIRSPLLVLLSAALVNLLGDMAFVGCTHPVLHGAPGAALATVISQYAAVVFFLHWLKTKSSKPIALQSAVSNSFSVPSKNGDCQLTSRSKNARQVRKPWKILAESRFTVRQARHISKRALPQTRKIPVFSTRGYLASVDFRKRDVVALPKAKDASEFLPYVVPVTTTSVGRVSLFLAMAHVVSSCMGTVGMACQQIVMSIFEALCPIADSLSLTAQSFVPGLLDGTDTSRKGGKEMRKATAQFIKTGFLFGMIIVGIVSGIPLASKMFTTDALVAKQVNAIAPYLAGVFAMHGVVMASEGVLLGRRDLKFLGTMYGIYFCLVPALLLRLKRVQRVTGTHIQLQSVWTVFLSYQLSRMILWMGRALWLARSRNRDKVVAEGAKCISPAARSVAQAEERDVGFSMP